MVHKKLEAQPSADLGLQSIKLYFDDFVQAKSELVHEQQFSGRLG